MTVSITTSIAPWLTVIDGRKALEFYKNAFGAIETYRLDNEAEGLVARLSIGGAEFWISSGNSRMKSTDVLGGETIRMIFTIANADDIFKQALQAGAQEVFPIGEDHGWRLGRLVDPFGLHWEIGFPLST